MTEAPLNLTIGTLQSGRRLPMHLRLGFAIVAVTAIGLLAAASIDTPSGVPVKALVANAAFDSAPMRDPSVPEAGQVLSPEDRQREAWTPTF